VERTRAADGKAVGHQMRKSLFVAVLGGLLIASGCSPDGSQTGKSPSPEQRAESVETLLAELQTKPYAPEGAKRCLTCHNVPELSPILQSPHAVEGDPRTPFAQHGCESCHGPSPEHLKSPISEPSVVFHGKFAAPPAVQNQVCLSCHESGLRMNWQGSAHDNNDVTCISCHTIHVRKDPILVKVSEPEKCFTCHAEQRAESFKYSHHPIREGKVVCSDCHNPHGSPGPELLKEFTVNETCYNCHADKRGPMLWEHQPVRDNCLNCHTPHGSNQPRLMKEQMAFLCSSCHSAEANQSGGAFGGGHGIPLAGRGPMRPGFNQGSVFYNEAPMSQRGCLNCHSQVHGSNSPSGAFFIR
jgi:DmsE family decaheme c-type cytochrome